MIIDQLQKCEKMNEQKYLGGEQSMFNQNWREIRDNTVRARTDSLKRKRRKKSWSSHLCDQIDVISNCRRDEKGLLVNALESSP